MAVDKTILQMLAPKGVLRAGINMANFLLVSSTHKDGTPVGVSPDVAIRIAEELDVPCEFVLFDGPGQLADAADDNIWDIGNIAIEPARAEVMDFSHPYVQIDANFLVKKDAPFTSNVSVDNVGVTIAAYERSAYDLWLSQHLSNATIVRSDTIGASHDMFREGKTDVLASLKPKLIDEISAGGEYRIIEPPFTGIQQAVGLRKGNPEATYFLDKLIKNMIEDGFIAHALKTHGVENHLSVPKPAT